MAEVHGIAEEWARVKGTVAGLWPLFLGLFAGGFALAMAIFGFLAAGLALFTVAFAATGLALIRGMRRIASFFIGARGEERVSRILSELPPGYHVFNDFVAKGRHIDHVVVGPAGVYAVETKCWRGEVTVEDGHILFNGSLPSRAPLAQALNEAEWVRAALAGAGWKGRVTPVLVFASNSFRSHIAEVGGAVVMNASEIGRSFASGRATIAPDELERLVSIMENGL